MRGWPLTLSEGLFMDIYVPSTATASSNLPVYFFIQGGGFNSNSNANLDGSGLVIASGSNIIVVTINYRVGPYGFLAGKLVPSLNNGLKDQRAALGWVQGNIKKFGGNPAHVTLGGDSAGAQSVNLHSTAYGGRNDGLFHATAAESQSHSALLTVAESQFMYDNLVSRAKCTGDTLACLRGLSATALQAINFNTPFPGATDAPLYMYGPTLDYDFITDYTHNAYANGKYLKLPAITGDDQNEGTIFTPQSISSYSQSNTFIKDQFPKFTADELTKLDSYYTQAGTPQFSGVGSYFRQAAWAYGEVRYTCPGNFIAGVYANAGSTSSWNYRWNVGDQYATPNGISHTIEINAIWGPDYVNGAAPASYKKGGADNSIVAITQAYWTSFIRSYNPNTYRASGSPTWNAWTSSNSQQRLMFQTSNTQMEAVPAAQQTRCAWLSSIAASLGQ